jgi:hypothetical protein
MVDLATAKLLLNVELRVTETHSDMKELVQDMATVREVLTQLTADVAGIKEDVGRVLQRSQDVLDQIATGNVDLSPELQAEVDTVRGDLANLNQQMDAAVPPNAPAPTEPEQPVNL